MNKKKLEKIAMVVIPVISFILVLLVVLSFDKDSEDVVIDTPPIQKEEEITFTNQSYMEESEIREIVERKRFGLQLFFKGLKYYNISDVAEGYTVSDNKKYIVIGESYLKTLRNLLTTDAYSVYWDQLTEVAPKATIQLKERIYMGEANLFTSLFTHSAIATEGVNVESLILKSATNEKIEAVENIKYCEENVYNVCQRNEMYTLTLEVEEDTWKISEFTKLYK